MVIEVLTSFYSFEVSVVGDKQTDSNGDGNKRMETDGERRRETTILTHNFFSTALWDAAPAGRPATLWCSLWLTESLLVASWDWLKTDCILSKPLNISFHNAHHFHLTKWLLRFIYTSASCIEKSLIDSSAKGHMQHQRWMQELIYISSVRTVDVIWKTCRQRLMIGTDAERESGKSMQSARLDNVLICIGLLDNRPLYQDQHEDFRLSLGFTKLN